MSQITMSQEDRQKTLQPLGYSEREAQFLCSAALHGGYFLRRQYEAFLGHGRGGAASQLIEKTLAAGHARAYTYRYNTNVYHLYALRCHVLPNINVRCLARAEGPRSRRKQRPGGVSAAY
jgi:hypothetical protein